MSFDSSNTVTIRRALLSVSDKTYLEELAKTFSSFGIELIATGGTAEKLKRAGISYRPIETFTGNPEAFDGRMKTLSFKLESAILFDRSKSAHVDQAKDLGIEPIDCVVCNFYPFEEALARGATETELVHEIDIGGPTMVRAAAKNFHSVLVLTDPADYQNVLSEMRHLGGAVSLETRKQMMIKAFARVTHYDQAILDGFSRKPLRYGENPHQKGYFVPDQFHSAIEWNFEEAGGIELSYNNFLDAEAAFGAVQDALLVAPHGHGACAIVKHNNPCGLAIASTTASSFERAWAGDPVSSFGGVVALSSPLTVECARLFDEKFIEVLLAPDFEEAAVEELRRKKKKLRILKINRFRSSSDNGSSEYLRTRIEGGTLVQQPDEGLNEEFRCVTSASFPEKMIKTAHFAVVAAKWIKSNAIAIARPTDDGGFQLVGMGSGQPNRIDAIRRLAVPKAREVLGNSDFTNCVLASDAFFPFSDAIEEAHAVGLRYLVQPGGSIRDKEVIACADQLEIAMAFTGRRHFRH